MLMAIRRMILNVSIDIQGSITVVSNGDYVSGGGTRLGWRV